jgi:hypothetical protein
MIALPLTSSNENYSCTDDFLDGTEVQVRRVVTQVTKATKENRKINRKKQ